MKSSKFPSSSPRRIIIFAVSGAALIIIAGSVFALNQAGIGLAAFAGIVSETVSRLAGANLIVKVDRTTLPADGSASTIIHVTTTNQDLPVTAQVIGGGRITNTSTTASETQFTYTAGTVTGLATIEIHSGSLTETVEINLAEAVTPTAPILTSPTDRATTTNPIPEVSGTGPANTKILITTNGTENTTTQTDGSGNFKVVLAKPLYGGQHTIAAIAISDIGVQSPVSNLITITIETEAVKLDTNHIRVSPNHPVANGSFGLFIPVSLNTSRVTAELQGRTFELTDLHKTSVFTGTLASPEQAGTYSIDLTLFDLAGTATHFDRAYSILVVSD